MARVVALGDCVTVAARLEQRGQEVLCAAAPQQALGLVQQLSPQLILVGADADIEAVISLVGQMRVASETELTPILLLRHSIDKKELERLLAAGVNEILRPDVDVEELLARIDRLLSLRAAIDRRVAEARRATLIELAGAVAHRINQPLTSMSVIVETMAAQQERQELSDERLATRLRELHRLVDKMALIVKRIANLDEYRTTPYVGEVRIIDLDKPARRKRRQR